MRHALITSFSVVIALSLCLPAHAQFRPDRPQIRQGTLKDGDSAPDFTLKDVDGKNEVKLADLKGKPVVLIFGSCTCPPFVSSMKAIEKLHAAYKEKVHFLVIYIKEAHPTDGRVQPGNDFEVKSPKTDEERREIAKEFARRLKVSIPILVDAIDDKVEKAYACWPNRLYILDGEGKIADKGAAGPRGTTTSASKAAGVLDKLLKPAE
ncbi:MAG: deiodinase-like protein [Phycisphaeraceae bacterium]